MAHVKPEHLLEPRDYRQWVKTWTTSIETTSRSDGNDVAAVNDVLFESLSKRAWMDVLLQLIKVSLRLQSLFSVRL